MSAAAQMASPSPGLFRASASPSSPQESLQARLLRAPLVPVALSATLGVFVERTLDLPPVRFLAFDLLSLLLLAVALVAGSLWAIAFVHRRLLLAAIALCCVAGCIGAAWHRLWLLPAADDIRWVATVDGHLARLRGEILEVAHETPEDTPLRSLPAAAQTVLLVRVHELQHQADWERTSGRTKVWIAEKTTRLSVGAEIELLGMLRLPSPPGNPGEIDTARHFRDQGISALVYVKNEEVLLLRHSPRAWSPSAGLARLRVWAAEEFERGLAPAQVGIARALILGEQSALEQTKFEAYQRTGVFHVLAISGQHVVVLCGLLWIVLRLFGLPRRGQALAMFVLVLAYCLFTGARPPMVRSTAVVCTFCLGVMLGRRAQPLNSLALAWLVTIVFNPPDIFETGCQISFLGVLVLFQVVMPWHRWATSNPDPLQVLIDENRPLWQRLLRQAGSWLGWILVANLVLALAYFPLLADRYHLVSPITIVLSPVLMLLTSVALIAGFLFLLLAPIGAVLTMPFAWTIDSTLALSDALVRLADLVPAGAWYASRVPEWALWSFYAPLVLLLLFASLERWWKPALIGAGVWLVVVLLTQSHRPRPDGLRCTFLAVGHGSCVVLETPDNRVLLYDAGSMAGPEVTARKIAPFLWSRGINRIDEIFISHADLDHFNGLPALLDRFAVAQISLTPTFQEKAQPGVQAVFEELNRRGIPVRILSRGQELQAGELRLRVLHPPELGPEGSENARSLVLHIRAHGGTLLLTGDLEEPGLTQVTAQPPPPVDVLLAPHHGSRFSNTTAFAAWARPGLVVSSEGQPRGPRADPYAANGATVWRTWQDGAVTIIMDSNGIHAEAFRTRRQWAR
jgi:competence protein ComEC